MFTINNIAQTHFETGGNDQDVDFSIFQAGPATASGYYDLAMPFYVTTKGASVFGISGIKTSGGLGAAGTLYVFDATGSYLDSNFDSTPQRLITNVIWKAPSSGTFTFYMVLCTGSGPSAIKVNSPFNLNYRKCHPPTLFTVRSNNFLVA